nr:hypothetical protein [Tanacetum cinerariifolium]
MILDIQTTDPSPRPTFDFTAKLFSNMKLNWDGPHMPLLAPMLVVSAARDGADAVVAGHTSEGAASEGPIHVRYPTPVREPTPSPVREPTPNYPRHHSPLPRKEEVGPTTSTRPPIPTRYTSVHEDFSEGGGDFVSSPRSNEAPQTPAATAAGGVEDSTALTALYLKLDMCLHRVSRLETKLGITKKVLGGVVLKLVTRVKRMDGLLQQRKQRLVLSDSEGVNATSTEQDIDLVALHTLASTSLGGDSSAPATGHDAAEVPADITMPSRHPSTTRRRLKKPFSSSAFAHVSKNIPAGASVPAAATIIPAGSSVDAAVPAAAAPSFFIPTTADKGKAPMVDDSLPADLLSEKPSLPDSKRSWHRRFMLNVLLLLLHMADWLELLDKITTNSALSKHLLGDDVMDENMNERLGMLLLLYNQGWTIKKVKALSIAQLRLEFEYIQQHLELSNLLNFRRSTFRPKPTLDAPSAKRANQGVLQVPAASSQVPAGVPAALSFPSHVSVHAATSSALADISVPNVSPAHVTASVLVETVVHTAESHVDDPLTASEHVSTEPTVATPTPSSSRIRRKHITKKRVTPIVDMADAAMIKFDSDDDPCLTLLMSAGKWFLLH